jgi:hypothetical protein
MNGLMAGIEVAICLVSNFLSPVENYTHNA